jgi:ferredoxin
MNPDTPETDSATNRHARSTALAAAERLSVRPTGIVRYTSRGRVLVVGGEQAQWFAARVQTPLHAEILLTDGETEPGAPTTALAERAWQARGHLGAFEIDLGERGRHNHQQLQADLIVDFGSTPLFSAELPPPGYWHFGQEPQDLDAAQLVIDGMVGTFEKPRYFDYDPEICAHARSGQPGCRRCIESCPADAIISIGERIEVNPNLCQGGGSCATVCPTGAIRYAYPPPTDTATRLRTLLRTYLDAGGSDPVVLFVAEADTDDMPALAPNVLLLTVEELASVGHELWLGALAWGARCVMLADGGSVPDRSRRALDEQLAMTRTLLAGLGCPDNAIRPIDLADVPAHCAPLDGLPAAAGFSADQPKRQLARMAIDHLASAADGAAERIALGDSSPYGRIAVDGDRCTLCMSCTSVCPAGALSAGDEAPRLVFHEDNCVQCGICRNACPENAITLDPGYCIDPMQRRTGRVLNEEPPFCCVSCGKPFATRTVIDNILDKLAGHAMFQSERARRRLQMCEDCRVIDAVQDSDAMRAGLFGGDAHPNKDPETR